MQAKRVLNLETYSVHARDFPEDSRKRRFDELLKREDNGECFDADMETAQKRLRGMRQAELTNTLAYFNVDYPEIKDIRPEAILAMKREHIPIDLREYEKRHFAMVLPAVQGRIRSLMEMVCMSGDLDAFYVCKSCNLSYCEECMEDGEDGDVGTFCQDCMLSMK